MSDRHAGRPINPSRADAELQGFKTYTGSTHSKCGTAERYTKGGGCVHCARVIATEQREARNYLRSRRCDSEVNAEAEEQAKIDGRGDQGGGYPSSQGPLDTPPDDGLDTRSAEEKFAQSIEDDLM